MNDVRMDQLDLTPIAVKAGFAIAPAVSAAAEQHGLILVIKEGLAYLACENCGQSMVCLRIHGGSYWLTSAAIAGGIVSHLIQAHGWTRETVGDG